jgi:preprotein translocase subunit SecY
MVRMIESMPRSKILIKIIKNIFAAFCFIFAAFLFFAVVYETIITHELPTDNQIVQEQISDKYSYLPKSVFGDSGVSDDEENENEKEKYDKGWYD